MAQWNVAASDTAQRTFNPIRAIVDKMDLKPHPDKPMIPLSIGDPTAFPNLPPSVEGLAALQSVIEACKHNGYPQSIGYPDARAAVAEFCTESTAPLTAADVVIASGCSGAIDLSISVLADPGCNILIPRPGFSLYKTLCTSKGIETRSYNLLPEKSWEVDLAHLESLADSKTRAILLTNPSNPCGSVFTAAHIKDILKVAERLRVPIIADEVYAHMSFSGVPFHSVASLSENVPLLSCGGIAKRFVVPGWRLGWVLIHDRHDAFRATVRQGLVSLSQLILGANSLVQAALPRLLRDTPQSFYDGVMAHIEAVAKHCFDGLSRVPGLTPIMPQGAMYIMVGIDMTQFRDFADDRDFCQRLLTEQSVFCLPAQIFEYPNYFRVVTTVPLDKIAAAVERITEFCAAHHV